MPTIAKKIQRQQGLGNQPKVNQLRKLQAPKQSLYTPTNLTTTGGYADQAAESTANQPAPTPAVARPPNLSTANATNQADLANFSSYNPASGQPDPRDSNYWANLAKLMATSQQDYAGKQLEQSQSDTSYGLKLSQAGEDRRRGVRDLAESLIGTGLLRSGTHNRKQVEGTIDYSNQLAGFQQGKSNEDASRKAQMDAILSNLGIDEQGLYSDATGRYADNQANAAAKSQALAEVAGAPASNTGKTGKLGITSNLAAVKSKKKPKRKY